MFGNTLFLMGNGTVLPGQGTKLPRGDIKGQLRPNTKLQLTAARTQKRSKFCLNGSHFRFVSLRLGEPRGAVQFPQIEKLANILKTKSHW